MPLDGTVFILALHGTTPTCEAWTVAPTALTSGDKRVDYHRDHDDFMFEGLQRGDTEASCTAKLTLVEDATGWQVEDARWFRTKAACQTAIAHHAHVAMQWPCDPVDDVAMAPATKHHFDDVLAYGGIMYVEGVCNRVRFEAHRSVFAGSIEGSMSYRIPGGREEYGYQGQRGDTQLDLLGPSSEMDDGSSFGLLCADQITLTYAADHVGVYGNLYFDRATCRTATERTRYRESWLPHPAEEAGIGHTPLAGGC